jgi:hypothetical protein
MRPARVLGFTAALAFAGRADASANEKMECVQAAERGQDLRGEGKLIDARRDFDRCARASCPRAVAVECATWLEDVTARTPSIVVHGETSPGVPIESATLVVDGVALGAIDVLPHKLDPGDHVVRVVAAGRIAEARVSLREGEREAPVWLVLPAAVAPPAPRVVARPPLARPDPTSAEDPGIDRPRAKRTMWPAYLLTGVTVAAMGSFAFFGLEARHDFDQLQGSCAPSCSSARVDPVRTNADVADVSLGIGLVSLGAAVWTWLKPPQAASTSASITPVLGPLGVGLSGRF